MRKFIAALVFCSLSISAAAHEDRILSIKADGTIDSLPAVYGVVKVRIDRSPINPSVITGVGISSPSFNVRLSSCVTNKLKSITRVEASGSWYHDLSRMPPYVSLNFYTDDFDSKSPTSDYYSVTFSLTDGKILMGQRAWDPWWGAWRGELAKPADKCTGWQRISMWPNNSFKPSPHQGGA